MTFWIIASFLLFVVILICSFGTYFNLYGTKDKE
ncbi:hypothetical protein SAMN05192532_102323 [Alteribacillus iranensis]|uniref:Uncharacterized protein n=1 Tax=Alteribacillus iranensis TaxID=930128 RepID=A0A1I2BIE6_9BACI|nr:hypothetical protein SAMN05192532_102323 [Alteribacillus iranensis]